MDRDDVEQKISKLATQNDDVEITLDYLLKLVSNTSDLFKSSRIEQKRKIIKMVFPNLYLDGGNISYTIKKTFELLLKGLSCSINLGWKDCLAHSHLTAIPSFDLGTSSLNQNFPASARSRSNLKQM